MILRRELNKNSARKPVHFRAFVNKVKVVVATFTYVDPQNWSDIHQRAVYHAKAPMTRKEVSDVNLLLDAISNRGQKIFIDHQISGEYLRPEDFKNMMQSGTEYADVHAFIQRQLELRAPTLAPNTIKHLNTMRRIIKDFRPTLYVNELSPDTIQLFDGFMRKRGIGANTRAKLHRDLKTITTKMIERFRINDPYKGFKMPKAETQREFLISSEVQKLIDLHDSEKLRPETKTALKKYLFSCHCGELRISDIHSIGRNDIVNDMLIFVPQKTKGVNKTVKIPWKPLFEKFIENQQGDHFFNRTSDQRINTQLKTVAKAAGINKKLTFHTARHTFATGYLAAGGSIEVLQQILRHSKLEVTQVYVHITNERVREESERIELYRSGTGANGHEK